MDRPVYHVDELLGVGVVPPAVPEHLLDDHPFLTGTYRRQGLVLYRQDEKAHHPAQGSPQKPRLLHELKQVLAGKGAGNKHCEQEQVGADSGGFVLKHPPAASGEPG